MSLLRTRSTCTPASLLIWSISLTQVYRFGGTDCQYHYNDTWVFDTTTNIWTELTCIGFIPSPREGHAASLVDDVIYVFGGRGVDGKDLGDLGAFKISSESTHCIWYTIHKPERNFQTNDGTCSKRWVLSPVHGQGMQWHPWDPVCLCSVGWVVNRWGILQSPKTPLSFTSWTRVR